MTRITLDEPLKSKLHGLHESVELCDENGVVVGHVLPKAVYERLIYDSINARVTDEELEEALNEPRGMTLKEFWAKLGNQ